MSRATSFDTQQITSTRNLIESTLICLREDQMPNGQIMDFLEDLHDPREDNKWHKLSSFLTG
jgi:hypothetical protein